MPRCSVWSRLQPPPNEDIAFLDNAGRAWSQGVELATIFTPVEALQLGVNAAYTETELIELGPDATPFPGRSGDHLPAIPKWSALATAELRVPAAPSLTGPGRHRLSVCRRAPQWVRQRPAQTAEDSYEALDLNAEISAENWTLRLFSTNVPGEQGQIRVGQANNPAFSPPRFCSRAP